MSDPITPVAAATAAAATINFNKTTTAKTKEWRGRIWGEPPPPPPPPKKPPHQEASAAPRDSKKLRAEEEGKMQCHVCGKEYVYYARYFGHVKLCHPKVFPLRRGDANKALNSHIRRNVAYSTLKKREAKMKAAAINAAMAMRATTMKMDEVMEVEDEDEDEDEDEEEEEEEEEEEKPEEDSFCASCFEKLELCEQCSLKRSYRDYVKFCLNYYYYSVFLQKLSYHFSYYSYYSYLNNAIRLNQQQQQQQPSPPQRGPPAVATATATAAAASASEKNKKKAEDKIEKDEEEEIILVIDEDYDDNE